MDVQNLCESWVCSHSSSTGGGVETDESPSSWPASVGKLKSSRLSKRTFLKAIDREQWRKTCWHLVYITHIDIDTGTHTYM